MVRGKRERLLKLHLAGTFETDDVVYSRQEKELQRQEADTASRFAVVGATAVHGLNRLDAEGQARLLRPLVIGSNLTSGTGRFTLTSTGFFRRRRRSRHRRIGRRESSRPVRRSGRPGGWLAGRQRVAAVQPRCTL